MHFSARSLAVSWVLLVGGCPGGSGDTTVATTGTDDSSTSATGASGEPTTGGTAASTSSTEVSMTEAATTEATSTSGGSSGGSTSGGSTSGETTSGESSGGESSGGGVSGVETGTDGSSGGEEGTTGVCVLHPDAEMTQMALAAAVEGVDYPSESDYPWVVFAFACAAPVNVDNLKELIAPIYVPHDGEAPLADREIEVRTMAQLFDPLTVPEGWWTDYEYMRAEKYLAIRMVLEDNLTDLQVFRLGEKSGNVLSGAIDVYVIGATGDGDLVGMWTVSVET